jgi:oligoendopeptidase F
MPRAAKEYTWDLTPLLKSDNDPYIQKERAIIEKRVAKFIADWKERADYLKDPKVLKQALDDYEAFWSEHGDDGNQGYYFSLRSSQNQDDPDLKAKHNKVIDFGREQYNKLNFFQIRISKIPEKEQPKFLKSKDLRAYKHFLERLFAEAKHVLSESEEEIMVLKSQTAYSNWVSMVSDFVSREKREVVDPKGKKQERTFAEISSLINDTNQNVRDSAAEALNSIVTKHLDVAEYEINSVLENKKVDDQIRKFARPDASRHLADDVAPEIVDTLVVAVTSQYKIAQDFYKLKAKLLGKKKLKYHERNVPIGKAEKKYTYEQSTELILKVFKNLDPEFADITKSFIQNRQIDVYPRKGKRAGAFCAYNLKTQPVYILLNHTDKLTDVLTIAHELGHGINDELIKQKQNSLNCHTPMSTAEVASTFMEDFVLQELLKEADDSLKLSLMMQKLNDDISTIIRQIACYKFEQKIHEEYRKTGYLSKETLGKIFQKEMAAYMGPAVEQSPGSQNWWVYWSHIRSFFYVYSYASGLLISKALQKQVQESPKKIENVKEFLSTGTSKSPKEIFQDFGIDIQSKKFWLSGLGQIQQLLTETTALARKMT